MWRKLTTSEKRRLLALALVAALVRAVYLWLYSRRPEWGELVVDSLFHVNWADDIAGGNVIGDRAFFRSPLYIYVLALFRWLAPTALWPPRVFGSALGVVSIVLTYFLVRRIYRGKHSERAALAAAALQAVYPSVIYFEAELLVDFLFTVLLQATALAALTAGAERRRWLWAGALVGLAALTRATGLIVIPLLAYWAWRDYREHTWRLTGAASVVVAALVIIAPVSLRNLIVSGDFTLIATSGGVNFYIGANPGADPVSAALPEPCGAHWRLSDMRGLAEEFEGRSLTDAEVSASWRNRALDWIVSHPVDFGALYLRKLGAMLYTHPYSNNRALAVEFAANPVTRFSPLNFAALLSLAALGLGVSWNSAAARRLAALALLYSLMLCLFFINERFRLPVIVALFPLAGIGAVNLWESLRGLARGRAPAALRLYIAPLAALALALAPILRPVENAAARALYLRGNAALREGRTLEARELFRAALAEDPRSPRAALNLGVTYFLSGAADSAEYYFHRELQRSPSQPDALTNLASLKLTAGDLNAADSLSQRAYQVRAYDLTTVRLRLRICAALGEMARYTEIAGAADGKFSADPRYWTERGLGYLQHGDTAAARESFERSAALDYRRLSGAAASDWAFEDTRTAQRELADAAAEANYRLGFLAGVSGDYRSAQRRSGAAIAIDSSRAPAYTNLILAYLSLGAVDSANAVYDLALVRFAGDERALHELRPAGGALGR